MIDLHSHILPGIDDGSPNIEISLAMARAWVADGVEIVACTPHIMPGVYNNTGPQIRQAVADLQQALVADGVALQLVTGADNHVAPDMAGGIGSGRLLTLADSRYVLVEPPHHVAPPRLEDLFFSLLVAGYVPILTHPERLSWMPANYAAIQRLVQAGVWMQVTAGALLGAFGSVPKSWAERMLDDGCVHILATDAHDIRRRPPNLAAGRAAAAMRVGMDEAERLVLTRPRAILENQNPTSVAMPTGGIQASGTARDGAEAYDIRGNRKSSCPRRDVAGAGVGARIAGSVRRFLGQ